MNEDCRGEVPSSGRSRAADRCRTELRLGTPVVTHFFYVYIIQSERFPERFYTGFTEDLEKRLPHHNAGSVPATKPYRPWKWKTCTAFTNREQALAFERYLKSRSGRAFAKKRL